MMCTQHLLCSLTTFKRKEERRERKTLKFEPRVTKRTNSKTDHTAIHHKVWENFFFFCQIKGMYRKPFAEGRLCKNAFFLKKLPPGSPFIISQPLKSGYLSGIIRSHIQFYRDRRHNPLTPLPAPGVGPREWSRASKSYLHCGMAIE